MTTSLLTPVTPAEHSPYAAFCTLRAQRSVDPTRRMFSVPASAPEVGTSMRPRTSNRWIWWFKYQP